jgi:uncharacterized membrane protein
MILNMLPRLRRGRRSADRERRATRLVAASAAVSAAIYLFDPDKGRRRRGLIRDRVIHLARVMPHGIAVAGRDLSNRLRGVGAGARRIVRPKPADDAVLEARVRSELGRVVRRPKAIRAEAHDGSIVLSGRVLRAEVDRLRATVRSVEGVREVEDRLDVFDEPGRIPDLQGAGKPIEPRADFLQANWSPATRLIAVLEGSAYAALGLYRRGRLGAVLVAAGTLVILRGLTNISMRRLLGIGGRRGIDVQKAIEVDAPVDAVFAVWNRFEEFPRFMRHVREVRRDGDRSSWTLAGPAGLPIRFDAVTTRHEPNEVIAWKSVRGEPIRHTGIVRFEALRGNRARVTVRMSYNPPAGVLAHALATLFGADPRQALDDDLLRLKSLLTHGKATGDGEPARLGDVAPEAAAWGERPAPVGAVGDPGVGVAAGAHIERTGGVEEIHAPDPEPWESGMESWPVGPEEEHDEEAR